MLYYPYMASNDNEISKKIGENIKRVRESQNLTQEDVAKEAKMTANYFAKIERGTIGTAPEKIYKIIKALKVKASEIFPS